METDKKSLEKILPYIMLIAGVIGLAASLIIWSDTLKLAADPGYHPSCSLNPVISCGSVMKSSEARLFGFDNPYIGLAAFPALIITGIAFRAGVRLKRWVWLGLNAGALFGTVFVHYLFIASVYHIHALCPYCLIIWAVTITTFWYVTLYNLESGNIALHPGLRGAHSLVRRHHADILIAWLLVIAALILAHFWYFFGRGFS
jgi:uncharacterized membrane protein